MEKIRSSACSRCKKHKEELYSVEAFWEAPMQVQSDVLETTYTYIKNGEVKVNYNICTRCVEKHIKRFKIVRYVIGSFLTLFALAFLIVLLQEVFNPGSGPEGIGIFLELLILLFLTVVIISAFIKQDHEKLIMKSLDAIVKYRLSRDLESGKIAKNRKGNIRGVLVRTELTITKKTFREIWDFLY